jgi:hypothetical protein
MMIFPSELTTGPKPDACFGKRHARNADRHWSSDASDGSDALPHSAVHTRSTF